MSKRVAIKREKKLAIFEAQNWRCAYCGVRMVDPVSEDVIRYLHEVAPFHRRTPRYRKMAILKRSATVDHLKEVRNGGRNARSNLVGCCHHCNQMRRRWSPLDWFELCEKNQALGLHPCRRLL